MEEKPNTHSVFVYENGLSEVTKKKLYKWLTSTSTTHQLKIERHEEKPRKLYLSNKQKEYIKPGDLIEDPSSAGYRMDGTYIVGLDGKILDLSLYPDEYGTIPSAFDISMFPPLFWKNSKKCLNRNKRRVKRKSKWHNFIVQVPLREFDETNGNDIPHLKTESNALRKYKSLYFYEFVLNYIRYVIIILLDKDTEVENIAAELWKTRVFEVGYPQFCSKSQLDEIYELAEQLKYTFHQILFCDNFTYNFNE